MFLIITLILSLVIILVPNKVVNFYIKIYIKIHAFTIDKNLSARRFIIFIGFLLFVVSTYHLIQKTIGVDQFGISILLIVSICLMVFSNYFINSIKKYCELLLEGYEERRSRNILITRVSGLIGFVVIAYLLFKQNH